MSVENDVHHRPPITVADGSGAKPVPPSKPGPARPTPGNANSPVRKLPDIKADPKPAPERALSSDIDAGLRDMCSGKLIDGRIRIADGIREAVKNLNGNDHQATYAEAKRATGKI